MKSKVLIGLLVLAVLAFVWLQPGFTQKNTNNSLFVNLTSQDTNRAAMAIFFAQRTLNDRGVPVTVFLNVEGVFLANKNKPQSIAPNGKMTRELLVEFIKSGGKVLVCPMCMKNVGNMTADDLIEGAVVADTTIWDLMFAEGARIISY